MLSKVVVLAAIVAPLAVRADPAPQADANLGAQFATTLSGDGTPARAPKLGEVTARKAPALPAARAAAAPKLADGQYVAPPTIDSNLPKVEALGPRSVPAAGTPTHIVRPGHSHRATLATFELAQLRAGSAVGKQVDDVARSWKTNLKWDAITVEGSAANVKLAQHNADEVRAYLVRHGVPGDYVVTVARAEDAPATAAKIQVSVATCDDVTIACRKPAPAK